METSSRLTNSFIYLTFSLRTEWFVILFARKYEKLNYPPTKNVFFTKDFRHCESSSFPLHPILKMKIYSLTIFSILWAQCMYECGKVNESIDFCFATAEQLLQNSKLCYQWMNIVMNMFKASCQFRIYYVLAIILLVALDNDI